MKRETYKKLDLYSAMIINEKGELETIYHCEESAQKMANRIREERKNVIIKVISVRVLDWT